MKEQPENPHTLNQPHEPVLGPQRLTPVEYGNVKAQLRARQAGGWAAVEWALARRPALHELELVHARLLALNPKVWAAHITL